MSYPSPLALQLPLEPYEVREGYYKFGTRVRSRVILSARHLGDDLVVAAVTLVLAFGEGLLVWAGVRAGSKETRNWGGLVVLAHQRKDFEKGRDIPETFYSVYGHMKDLTVKVKDTAAAGQQLGVVAPGETPENGWWKIAHLHFAIYVGAWTGEILPGYKRPFDGRTKMKWWRDPKPFIEEYNKG